MGRLIFMIQEIVRKVTKDNITSYAAQSCFYILLSFFPFVILFMMFFKYLPVSESTLFTFISTAVPAPLDSIIANIIEELYTSTSGTIMSITTITIIWAAGKSFMAIIQAMSVIYDTDSSKNWFIQRFISILCTLTMIIVIMLSLLLLVFGNQILLFTQHFMPSISKICMAIINNKIILFPTILTIMFLAIYLFIPRRKSYIIYELPGALFASIGWCLFSFFYSLYINHSPNFSYMYGSLTTLIFALMWLYICIIILFLGAELNTFIQKGIIPLKFHKNNTDKHNFKKTKKS